MSCTAGKPNFRLLDYECYAFALDDVPIVR